MTVLEDRSQPSSLTPSPELEHKEQFVTSSKAGLKGCVRCFILLLSIQKQPGGTTSTCVSKILKRCVKQAYNKPSDVKYCIANTEISIKGPVRGTLSTWFRSKGFLSRTPRGLFVLTPNGGKALQQVKLRVPKDQIAHYTAIIEQMLPRLKKYSVPREENKAVEALREQFPELALRLQNSFPPDEQRIYDRFFDKSTGRLADEPLGWRIESLGIPFIATVTKNEKGEAVLYIIFCYGTRDHILKLCPILDATDIEVTFIRQEGSGSPSGAPIDG